VPDSHITDRHATTRTPQSTDRSKKRSRATQDQTAANAWPIYRLSFSIVVRQTIPNSAIKKGKWYGGYVPAQKTASTPGFTRLTKIERDPDRTLELQGNRTTSTPTADRRWSCVIVGQYPEQCSADAAAISGIRMMKTVDADNPNKRAGIAGQIRRNELKPKRVIRQRCFLTIVTPRVGIVANVVGRRSMLVDKLSRRHLHQYRSMRIRLWYCCRAAIHRWSCG
jgi:hypothetical protein